MEELGFKLDHSHWILNKVVLLSESISYTQDSDAAIHAMAGFQLKIAILRIYVEATMAEYATVNAGIGIGLRN